MRSWFGRLDLYCKTALVTAVVSIIAFLATIPLYFFSLGEVPNGIILTGSIMSVLFLLYEIGKGSSSLVKTIVANVVRFLLIAALLFVTVFLYYRLEIKIFNVFAVIGTIMGSTVIFAIMTYLEGKHENSIQ